MKPKKKVQIRTKKPTFKDAQKYLRAFFKRANDYEKGSLWDVLSALRGPDDQNSEVKMATTAVIRQTFLPQGLPDYLGQWDDAEGFPAHRTNMEQGHFRSHARDAFVALGLKWGKVNKPAK